METWKIKNITEHKVKISIALGGANNPGIILEPGQIVLSIGKMTGPLDKQFRSGLVEIEKNFDNSKLELPLGQPMIDIEAAIKNVENYSEK